jgi:hypothetical protein
MITTDNKLIMLKQCMQIEMEMFQNEFINFSSRSPQRRQQMLLVSVFRINLDFLPC